MNARGPRSPLDRLLAEVRAQRVPEPVEPGLPPRLRAEFQSAAGLLSAPLPARPAAVRRWWPALVLAAAAALVLARVAVAPEQSGRADVPIATLDGQALDVGVLVVATDQPRRVEHAGRASWVLAPGSQARLLSVAGGVLRISLEQGSLAAEVEQSQKAESFVVQAQGTEVAVHGTRFVVSVLGERVHVVVTRGQVQVRPVALGRVVLPSSGTRLGPGMQADFWAGASEPRAPASTAPPRPQPAPPSAPVVPLGARPSRPRPPSAAAPAKPAVTPSAATPSAVTPSAATPSALSDATTPSSAGAPGPSAAPAAAPAASVEQALETVTGHVQRCFREQLRGSSELGIEASTRLGLWVEPDGELLRAEFDPPLAPAVEGCVARQLAHLRVAHSPAGFRVERDIRLRR